MEQQQQTTFEIKCLESLGYDCLHSKNLHILPKTDLYPSTLALISGTSIVFRSIDKQTIVRDPINTKGIGSIAIHPKGHVIAVGEKSPTKSTVKPKILLYSWPEVKLIGELEGASEKTVSYLTFAPLSSSNSVDLLASVSSAPDFMLTLWNWQEEKIVLRNKAYGQDTYKVTFSPYIEGQLCSAGVGHIKFWTMASTFTGIKLQGQLGRFGRTPISDIECYVMLDDGRVLSGSEWGNILLWDGGLIVFEIQRPEGKKCHDGPIRCMSLDESGELLTAGADGVVRVWNADAILGVDANEVEEGLFTFDCMNELLVPGKVTADILSLQRHTDSSSNTSDENNDEDEENMTWLAQDAKGAIWQLDLSFSHRAKAPVRVISSHAGEVYELATNEASQLMVSVGGHFLRVYKMDGGNGTNVICESQMNYKANSVIWRGRRHILVGHDDGVIRLYGFTTHQNTKKLIVQQALKPHTDKILQIYSTDDNKFIMSSSLDGTLFFYKCNGQEGNWLIEVLGFIQIPGENNAHVTSLSVSSDTFAVHIGTSDSQFLSYDMSSLLNFDTEVERKTFLLDIQPKLHFTFESCKDRLQRESVRQKAEEIRQSEIDRKKKQLKAKKDAGEEFSQEQEDEFLKVAIVEIDESPFFVPKTPGKILSVWSVNGDDTEFCMSLSGYDAGLLYQVNGRTGKVLNFQNLGLECEVTKVHRTDDNLVYFGFSDGSIRIYSGEGLLLMPEEFQEYQGEVHQHDVKYGQISSINTVGNNHIITSGLDGNIFRFSVTGVVSTRNLPVFRPLSVRQFLPVKDIENKDAWSLEQSREKEEEARQAKAAEKRRQLRKQKLEKLQSEFNKLIEANLKLPALARVKQCFTADEQVSGESSSPEQKNADQKMEESQLNVVRQNLLPVCFEAELATQKKHDYHVKPLVFDEVKVFDFNHSTCIKNYKLVDLMTDGFRDEYEKIRNSLKSRQSTRYDSDEDDEDDDLEESLQDGSRPASRPRSEMKNRRKTKAAIKPLVDVNKLSKEEKAKHFKKKRVQEWEKLETEKPDISKSDVRDEEEIAEAKRMLGDLKLKTSDDYVVPEEQRANAAQKKLQLMDQEKETYKRQYLFDQYVKKIVGKKYEIIQFIKSSVDRLEVIKNNVDFDVEIPDIPIQSESEVPHERYQPGDHLIQDYFERIDDFGKILKKKFIKKIAVSPSKTSQTQSRMSLSRGSISRQSMSVMRVASNLSGNEDMTQIEEILCFPDFEDENPDNIDENAWLDHQSKELEHEQALIREQINKKKSYFNDQVKHANLLRALVNVHVGAGQLTADTLLQESWLLAKFESRERALEEKVHSRLKDLQDAKKQRIESEKKLAEKSEQGIELEQELKTLQENFNEILPDNQKAAEWLSKVFKKKIKRKKVDESKKDGDGSDDDSDDSSDDDSDFSDEDGEGSEGGTIFDEKIKPGYVSSDLEAKCLALRENKLDIEDEQAELKKQSDQVRKESDALAKKVKLFDNQLTLARKDSELLQQEKQKALNQLWITVPMFCKNINSKLIQVPIKSKAKEPEHRAEPPKPKMLNECLVLPVNTTEKLESRILELEEERKAQRSLQDADRQQRIALARQKGEMELRCKDLEEQAKQLMELRFGRVVDLEQLVQGNGISSKGIDEKLRSIKDLETAISKDYTEWNARIQKETEQVTIVTKANTDLLKQLDELTEEQTRLNVELVERQQGDSKPKKQLKKPDDYMTATGDTQVGAEQKEETKQLENLIAIQTEKMNMLTAEIEQLSRKGGAVAPPK